MITESTAKAAADYRAAAGNPEPSEVYLLHKIDGLTYQEIAGRFGITRNQVAGFCYREKRRTASEKGGDARC